MISAISLSAFIVLHALASPGSPAVTTELGPAAPAFTLADLDGKKRSLSQFRGRSVALFFFCGCSWCTECAEEWAPLQRGGALPSSGGAGKKPISLVVYSGDKTALRNSAARWGLDKNQTVLLPDP